MTKKYRIKHESVEKAVRGLFKTQEAFEKKLNAWSEHHFKYHPDYSCIKIVANSAESITGVTCELYVATSDIEEVVEYDPKKWNQGPKVRPIKKGNYRVEHDENGYTYKFGFYWNGHFWEGRKGYGPIGSNSFQDGFRFKPWYDEWEDKE